MNPKYLLDTNICIYITKEAPQSVLEKFKTLEVGSVGMSIITYGELYFGIEKSKHKDKSKHTLEKLAHLIPPIQMPISTANKYGEIRESLAKKGTPIGNNDLWIASHAADMDLILVTNNEKEFSRVPKLKIENWVM